jgi:general secretion pathway protein G
MELLLVVTIILIVASILIPNWLNAIHKAKQKRTMAELKQIGLAWMSWLTDQQGPVSSGAPKTFNASSLEELDYVDLYNYLHPSDSFFYLQDLPKEDAWGSQLSFWKNPDLHSGSQAMICAAARDNIFNACGNTSVEIGPFESTDYDRDIIWADGSLLRWPESR